MGATPRCARFLAQMRRCVKSIVCNGIHFVKSAARVPIFVPQLSRGEGRNGPWGAAPPCDALPLAADRQACDADNTLPP